MGGTQPQPSRKLEGLFLAYLKLIVFLFGLFPELASIFNFMLSALRVAATFNNPYCAMPYTGGARYPAMMACFAMLLFFHGAHVTRFNTLAA
jgi:hypothetical protein